MFNVGSAKPNLLHPARAVGTRIIETTRRLDQHVETALSRVLEAQKPRPICMMCSGLMVWLVEEFVISFPPSVNSLLLAELMQRHMSAFWHKPDIRRLSSDVRFRG